MGRYLYGVLYNMTTGNLQGIVKQWDKQKGGIAGYRLFSIHCDSTNLSTSNTLKESIMNSASEGPTASTIF